MSIDAGTRIGKYEIQSLIGEGGMGKVYRALDTELHRPAALKFLPPEFSADERRMSRFVQEARAASALNHPNILTVYEIGQADSSRFFSTEFVEGVTLREQMAGRSLKLAEVLDVAIQIASALVAAHAAGIVHRDIKPENVMVRRDHIVKVLDFGLAKLDVRASSSVDMEAATRALVNTDPGAVMGTVGYMSPEQAAGKEVDARTDIWSLGVVLYEMIAGRLPFEGATPSHVIVSILEKEPPPMSAFAEGVPEALEWIVTEALTKEREERTQTARELLKKLQRLKQRIDAEAEIERSVIPHLSSTSGGGSTASGATQAAQTAAAADARTTAPSGETGAGVTQVSSAEYVVDGIRRHKKGVALALALLVVAVAVAGAGLYKLFNRSQPRKAISFEGAKLQRLTTTGKATGVAISPDGKYVVHVEDDGGQQSLWTRQVATQSNIEIVAPAALDYDSLIFSPDGDYIYYSVRSQEMPQPALFQVPTLGGSPKKVLVNLDSRAAISFAPDGKQFAFIRDEVGKEFALMIANADGTGERKLVAHKNPPESIGYPAWSPDGKIIAYMVLNSDTNDQTIFGAQVADGSTKPLTSQRWFRISALAWLSDGSGLLMLVTPQQQFVRQVYYLSYPEGEAHRLTNDLNDYNGMSLTADSGTLAVVKTERQANVWVAPAGDASRARPITSGSGKNDGEVAFAPDGTKIIYKSNASGDQDLWVVNADGSNQRQLTANARVNGYPSVSPDGRHIVFMSDRNGVPHIWRMNVDGSDQRQLSNGSGEQSPQFSPDGRWVVYRKAFGKATAWKVPADGGEPVQLSDKYSTYPTVSPDSKLVAYFYRDENAPWRIAVAPLEGGEPLKTFDLPATFWHPLHWTPDGRALAYIDTRGGVSNIVAQPLDGGAVKQLTNLASDRIFWFDFSRDGRQLALSRGTQTSDVILIKDFR
jgi:serine/threonine protein kinase/Tol biopolymer transport system component